MIHLRYLPFERQALIEHFSNEKYIDELEASAKRHIEFVSGRGAGLQGMPITSEVKRCRQMERDERFWTVSSLKRLFDDNQMRAVLGFAFGDTPPIQGFETWDECLGRVEHQVLRFEVGCPSPELYRNYLRERFRRLGVAAHLVPYLVDAARGPTLFEGDTQIDAVFGNTETGFHVLFETKLLSDIACDVRFDACRNQLARNIDIMLDERGGILGDDSSRRLMCLLTPELFYRQRSTRYYGLLFDAYKNDPSVIREHLPHRTGLPADLANRLGWLTFEECHRISPAACPWLSPHTGRIDP